MEQWTAVKALLFNAIELIYRELMTDKSLDNSFFIQTLIAECVSDPVGKFRQRTGATLIVNFYSLWIFHFNFIHAAFMYHPVILSHIAENILASNPYGGFDWSKSFCSSFITDQSLITDAWTHLRADEKCPKRGAIDNRYYSVCMRERKRKTLIATNGNGPILSNE